LIGLPQAYRDRRKCGVKIVLSRVEMLALCGLLALVVPPAIATAGLGLLALVVSCCDRYRTVDVAAASGYPSAIATAGLAWD
jgi:hypothetical protein